MSLLGGKDLKEQQKINELELKINKEKQKLDKKLTRQKILLGAFLVDALDKDSVKGLKQYTVQNLPKFLTRKTDIDLMKELIEGLESSIENNDLVTRESNHSQNNFS
ncbi:mobilization protein MobS [Psychrobacter sp. AOP31-E1-50]|uniref:mobilization protein MobS n=1 Tax=Psychrobacter sp. AOP31-E1-50 TaxID=3457692 RepID=UPI004035720A